jgi:hypothetical protein
MRSILSASDCESDRPVWVRRPLDPPRATAPPQNTPVGRLTGNLIRDPSFTQPGREGAHAYNLYSSRGVGLGGLRIAIWRHCGGLRLAPPISGPYMRANQGGSCANLCARRHRIGGLESDSE